MSITRQENEACLATPYLKRLPLAPGVDAVGVLLLGAGSATATGGGGAASAGACSKSASSTLDSSFLMPCNDRHINNCQLFDVDVMNG